MNDKLKKKSALTRTYKACFEVWMNAEDKMWSQLVAGELSVFDSTANYLR